MAAADQGGPLHDLTGFQRDLMTTISRFGDPHGLAIKDDLEEHYESDVNHSRLYPNLDTLVEKGLVDKSERDARTNAYTLMRRGRRELRSHVNWQTSCLEDDDA